jgi:hypothetical protein
MTHTPRANVFAVVVLGTILFQLALVAFISVIRADVSTPPRFARAATPLVRDGRRGRPAAVDWRGQSWSKR